MTKNLRKLLGAIRCKTVLYANKAKAQGTQTVLTDYTKPTINMLLCLRRDLWTQSFADTTKIKKTIDFIYTIEAQTEDYIRGVNYEIKNEESN